MYLSVSKTLILWRNKCQIQKTLYVERLTYYALLQLQPHPESNESGTVCIHVKFRHVRVTTVAVEKQYVLHILSLCLQPQSSSMQSIWYVPHCHLWRLYPTFPQYLINSTIFERYFEHKKILIFCTNLVWNIFNSKKNWARYYHTWA